MILNFDQLQALRACCQDEAAFTRLQQILATAQTGPQPVTPAASPSPPSSPRPKLQRGIAEAIHHLLTRSDPTTALQQILATLGQVAGADRAHVFETQTDATTGVPAMSQRCSWVRDGLDNTSDTAATPNLSFATFGLSRWYEQFSLGRAINSRSADLPPVERSFLESQGVWSLLAVPIPMNGKLWGFLVLADCTTAHQWPEDEEAVLLTIATNVGSTLAQQAETALLRSELRLQGMAANVPGMIYQGLSRADGSYVVLFRSSACQELFEAGPEAVEVEHPLIDDLVHPDDRQTYQQSVELATTTLQPWNWEGRIVTPSGKLKWLQYASRPERQPNGEVLWDGLVIDITERKQAEQELRHSEARYKALLNATPDRMFRLSREGRYLDFKGSEADGEEAYAAIVGQTVHELLPHEVAQLCLQTIGDALNSNSLQTCEYQLLGYQGLRDYEARVVVSGPDEVLVIVRDVTERKQAEAQLRTSEERLQSFFNATLETVLIHAKGRVLDVNHAAETLYGYTITEMIGRSVLELAAEQSRDLIAQRVRLPSDQSFEAIGLRKDGSQFTAEVTGKNIVYQGRPARVASIRDITQRQQAEEALRLSEEKFSKAFRASPDLITITQLSDGRCIEVNDSFLHATGYTRADILGRRTTDLKIWVKPALRDRARQLLKQQGAVRNLEYEFRTRAGDVRVGLFSAEVIHFGGERCVLAVTHDITERKQAEEALRHSEAQNRALLNAIPDLMFRLSRDGTYLDLNAQSDRDLAVTRTQMFGKTVYDVLPPDVAQQRMHYIERALQTGNIQIFEYQLLNRGRLHDYEARVVVSGADEVLMIVRDISERKQAEAQLRAAAERDRLLGEIALRIRRSLDLEQILNTTVMEVRRFLQADRVLISVYEEQLGKVVAESVSPNWGSCLGSVVDEPCAQELGELFRQGYVQVIDDVNQVELSSARRSYLTCYQVKASLGVSIILGERFYGMLVANQCSGPRHWQRFEIDLLSSLATQVAIAIQQAQLYRQVQTLNANLERQVEERTAQLQQKMQELQELNEIKDVFLHAVSHDLRTPVMGMLLVLKNFLKKPGEIVSIPRSVLERMVQSSDRQLSMVNSLLEVHTTDIHGLVLQHQPVCLPPLLRTIIEDFEPLLAKNQATLINRLNADLPPVDGDPVQLRRVFENLLANALKHNPPGLTLTLRAAVETNAGVRFTLQDDGVGLSQAECDYLFERYVRGPHARYSTSLGLGLYLCRQIVNAHGGQIGVLSAPGSGATFWLTLPLAAPTSNELQSAPVTSQPNQPPQ